MLWTIVGILGLGVMCGAWAMVQVWIGRADPDLRGDARHAAGGCAAHSADSSTASRSS